jgi:hypothetical protein
MTNQPETSADEEKVGGFKISLDAWAVALALGLALLIRIGLIKQVPW